MRTSALIGIGYALFASGALAECFSDNSVAYGDEQSRVSQMISPLCANGQLGNRYYDKQHTESKCYSISKDKIVNIRVENRSRKSQWLSTADCMDYLLKEISGCKHGGESKSEDGNWKIKVDPNKGLCPAE
ncbi:hypothetical protein ACKAV7_008448 [Fusarium commune]